MVEPERTTEDRHAEPYEQKPAEPLPPVTPWSKILVAFAGPLMNLIFAFVLATIIYFCGLPILVNPPFIGRVDPESAEGKLGIREGDRVALFMPLIPECAVAMLACARLGAIFTPIYSGFGASSVATRLVDSGARLLVTVDSASRRGRPVPLKAIADEAATESPSVERMLVVRRLGEAAEHDQPFAVRENLFDDRDHHVMRVFQCRADNDVAQIENLLLNIKCRQSVKLFADRIRTTDFFDFILTAQTFADHAWCSKHTGTGLPEGAHQCAVIKFADDFRMQFLLFQPLQQATAQGSIFTGQQHRRSFQQLRKAGL